MMTRYSAAIQMLALSCLFPLAVACYGESRNGDSGAENDGATGGTDGSGGKTRLGPDGRPISRPGGATTGPGDPSAGGGSGGSGGFVTSGGSGGSVTSGGSAGTPPLDPDGPIITPAELPPHPDCASPIIEDWQAVLGTADSEWTSWFGDPVAAADYNSLIVTSDDIIKHTAPLAGGYYLQHTLTLYGNTAFTPYPHAVNVPLPSLRRSGSDIELGGTSYGSSVSWSTTSPEGFAGVTIPGTIEALVTLYVKATSKELAVKVEAGGNTYRSPWIGTADNPETDLSIVYLVGENNSYGTGGSDDKVYVGPVRGCSDLGDADVTALYDE